MNSFCVIGLGKFGTSLALSLVNHGKQVMVIDSDADKVNGIADAVTNAVIGDATNEKLLRAAGVADYDCAVVCMNCNTSDIILATILLKELGVKKVIARAVNEGHKKVLERIGIDGITFPEHDAGEKLAFRLSKNSVVDYVQFSGYKIVEIVAPDEWIGKNLLELNLRRKFGINIIAVTAEGKTAEVSPAPDRPFATGDRVLVIGTDRNIERLSKFM